MLDEMDRSPFTLNLEQRKAVHNAITELCQLKGYLLRALNVRTNHVHSVNVVQAKPERVADSLKAYATKRLRENGLVTADERIWSRGRSRRYLWKPRDVEAAVNYVVYCQGDESFEEWLR